MFSFGRTCTIFFLTVAWTRCRWTHQRAHRWATYKRRSTLHTSAVRTLAPTPSMASWMVSSGRSLRSSPRTSSEHHIAFASESLSCGCYDARILIVGGESSLTRSTLRWSTILWSQESMTQASKTLCMNQNASSKLRESYFLDKG